MAIARDATSSGSTTATSLTVSHTNTGSNLILVASLITSASSAGDIVTGVTYNGVAMTRQSTIVLGGNVARLYMYYLLAPATGANDIVISTSVSTLIQSHNVSYTGVLQSGFPDASSETNTASATSLANTLTTIADNAIHLVYFRVGDNTVGYAVSNATFVVGIAGGEGVWESNPLLITPAASHTMTQSTNGAQAMASLGISIAPATSAGAVKRVMNLPLLGVG